MAGWPCAPPSRHGDLQREGTVRKESLPPHPLTVHEPATLLTDCLLGVLSLWLAERLRRATPTGPAAQWLVRVLALTALSALVGGSYHGFAPNFPSAAANLWWIATLLIIDLLSAALALSLLHECLPASRGHRPWLVLIALKFAGFAVAAALRPVFVVAIMDYGSILLAWTIAALWLRRKWSGWMLAGIGCSVLGALIQQLRWAPSVHFNHNDLYHVVQALALSCIYAAGRRFTQPAAVIPRAII